MKALFYIDTIGYGGAERVIVNLANQLIPLGYETTVVTTYRKKEEYALEKGVCRRSMDEAYNAPFLVRNLKLIKSLRAILREQQPDIAIAFLPESIFRLVIASAGLNIKKIFSVRSDPRFVYRTRLYKLLAKIMLPQGDGFVFQTEDARGYFPEKIQKKSTIIFNQVADEFYKHREVKERSGIVATGRLVPPKEHFFLVDAFELIKDRTKENLTIFGDGPLRERLEAYIHSKGLEKRVLLPGSVPNVAEKIYSAKVYVLSSNHEGMPNGLMEAMAAGVPCVSTDCPCGGPKTLFGEKQKEFLVPVNDTQVLAESIMMVITSEDIMTLLSEENKRRAELFTPAVVIKEWDAFIKKTIGEK